MGMTIDSLLSVNYPVNLFSVDRKYEGFLIFLTFTLIIPTLLSEPSEDSGSFGLEDSDGRALVIA